MGLDDLGFTGFSESRKMLGNPPRQRDGLIPKTLLRTGDAFVWAP
jgi:hypothetical protein